jgi:lysyl-tRNA synthetase class 1
MDLTATPSNYWLDLAVREILATYPKGEIIVSSGISPSASYHIGHFREIMTADALTWGIKQAGREAKHIHVVDNFDPLRDKPNPAWPKAWDYKQYVGWPVCLVPDPFDDCRAQHKTYAEHFYQEFEAYARQMGVIPDKVVRSYEDLYASGKMASNIEQSVAKVDTVKSIFLEVANRELPDDWQALQLLGPNKSFTELTFKAIDTESKTIIGLDGDGAEVKLDYAKGEVKLNWRLDWPARWQVLGVQVEPFSAQEHGAAGSSYDTGVRFSREIFGYEPPIPGVRYGNIHLLSETKKMSSSKGNLITPAQALEIMPPEVLRYFVVRSRPERTLYWDSGQGLFNLINEFATTKEIVEDGGVAEFADAYKYAVASGQSKTISSVPFDHLVQVYQAAQGDDERALEMIARTGFEAYASKQRSEILSELDFVANWLKDYAPESVKFEVQQRLPKVELSEAQTTFLSNLAGRIESRELDGQAMHEAIYAAKDEAGLAPGEAFKALYRVILNKDHGPKAGWFLASLDLAWLTKRLRLEA